VQDFEYVHDRIRSVARQLTSFFHPTLFTTQGNKNDTTLYLSVSIKRNICNKWRNGRDSCKQMGVAFWYNVLRQIECKIMFYSNNHNGIMFEIDRGFTLKSSQTTASNFYMLVSFVAFVAYIYTNFSVNLLRQTLYAAFHFALQQYIFLVTYLEIYVY
jgi:hypothetical protein